MEKVLTEQMLAKCVTDALRMMFSGPINQGASDKIAIPKAADGHVAASSLRGMSDSPSYVVTLRANKEGSIALASAMFSCTKKFVTPSMIEDAMCELTHMVSGQVKRLLHGEHRMSAPSILESDGVLHGAHISAGTRLHIGDATSEIVAVVANFEAPVHFKPLPQAEAEAQPHRATVAIGESDEATRGVLKAIVESAGMNVVSETPNGIRAFHDIRRFRPDVICLDIKMPEMNGLDVLAAVREEMPGAIVFLVSEFATAEDVREAVKLHANGIIVKPFERARIIGEIERALAQRHSHANDAIRV